ncbi:ArsI/CadI family heavy metal resistance metalloenzyme [Limnoglobus roseus]|uniref:Methyltransferase domain-containing protein n=1 Tax=Limnoglobus roseus TaxID=2598579 RepID=A0A5C1ATF9_9BACT|nr:ArsI/CadI family heavy metal resistance metalloenzyme [Limnoglobus roseus]QEL20892.1 methyltransferase domain-containing protein [Limnoglobus roseus]
MPPALNVIERPVAFHLAVNVTDLDRSLAFYRVLFGAEPVKCYADYAKFELADPPVVFSLVPTLAKAGGAMSHLGLRLTSESAVRAVQKRLEAAGVRTREQNGTRGCYAVQTKVWVEDSDGHQWEVYIVSEDLPGGDVTGIRQGLPATGGDDSPRVVVYKGPFRDLTDGEGRTFPRGESVTVPAAVWENLRQGPAADQFVFGAPTPATVTSRQC